MANLTYLHLGEHGTYMGAGFDYEYTFEDDKHMLSIRTDGVTEDDALVLETDEQFAQKLASVIENFRVSKWDGFSKSDSNVLDGDSFGFSARFDDKSSISAHGYMKYPSNYTEVKGALDALFMPLYESVRPNKRKVMTAYFEQVILKDTVRLENQEVHYPYIAKGGNMFSLGRCDCTGGAAWCPVYTDENQPEYMLVILLNEADEKWVLSCRVYRVTDDGEVHPWGEAEIDPAFFCSDKLYGHIFTRFSGDRLLLGVFTQKGFTAAGKDTKYYIDLYDIKDKLTPLANKMVQGPAYDKEYWTLDKLADFIETAQEYGFTQSLKYWEERPSDPVLASGLKDNTNHRFDFILSNNHNRDFYNTLINTAEGEPVGEYLVKGKLYFH